MARPRRSNRFCPDCRTRLVYYPTLSNPKAANEYRVLVYSCPGCTVDGEKPKMIAFRRNAVDDPIEAVRVEITQIRKKQESQDET